MPPQSVCPSVQILIYIGFGRTDRHGPRGKKLKQTTTYYPGWSPSPRPHNTNPRKPLCKDLLHTLFLRRSFGLTSDCPYRIFVPHCKDARNIRYARCNPRSSAFIYLELCSSAPFLDPLRSLSVTHRDTERGRVAVYHLSPILFLFIAWLLLYLSIFID